MVCFNLTLSSCLSAGFTCRAVGPCCSPTAGPLLPCNRSTYRTA